MKSFCAVWGCIAEILESAEFFNRTDVFLRQGINLNDQFKYVQIYSSFWLT